MKTIATAVLATVLSATGLVAVTATTAAADYRQVCVEGPTGWFAYTIESEADLAAIEGLRVEPFPNSAVGCEAYGPLAPAPVIPDATCEPEVVTRVVRVEVPGPVQVIETSSTQTVTDPALVAKVERQARKISRLQAKIRHLRNR
jgi:hypothetical protein